MDCLPDSRVSEAQISHLLQFCEEYPTPRTAGVSMLLGMLGDPLLRESAAKELMGLPLPCDHGDHQRFCTDRYASETLKKVPWLPLDVDRKAAALSAFWEAEASCKRANERLRRDPKPSWFGRVRKLISRILGPLDHQALSSIEELMRHGPGSAVGVGGHGSVPSDKYRTPISCTPALAPYLPAILGPSWSEDINHQYEKVPGCEWMNVPKNSATDRGIGKEPAANVYGQLGVGEFLLRKLMLFGVNLRCQNWNQALAEKAMDWDLATLDLKGASDHLSFETIRDLLPPDWIRLLSVLRSPMMKIEGKWIRLEKWSSMGNGYTFPLESLIFLAVVNSVVERKDMCVTAVYGDDIIVPQKAARTVIERLEYLGFRVNEQKSFLAGNFFESCGTDFLNGRECRPFYFPHKPGPIPKSVQTANGFRTWMKRTIGYCPNHLRPLWDELVKGAPKAWRATCVPLSWGDVGIIREKPLSKWKVTDPEREGYGWEGHLAKSIRFQLSSSQRTDHCDHSVVLAGLRRVGVRDISPSYGEEPVKGLYGQPTSRLAFSHVWESGLDWV